MLIIIFSEDGESIGEYDITDWDDKMEDKLNDLGEKWGFSWDFVEPHAVNFDEFVEIVEQ